ncbi:Cation efflux system protein CusA [Aquisphaera giovannonii]|uniref:Cation efflux system protein CusA n=1 Tax=Aquisphaera giovannonii TaxID=406548 RepID=A0A5B9WBY8_9BACT|nr:efflux RND transporter permease subunit [Aquisphaera giovannonii]QEH38092.1 Cation efflux system protein CusA [Aquisphaera giovannonii]
MIERVIEWSIRNRYLVILAALALGGLGARAMMTMPVDAIPDLSENQVIVFTDWMGRSPQEIEDQVTYPLSVNLQGLAGVKVVRSSSEFNFSMITIIFDEATDYYFARQRVLEKLSIATTFLPPGVTPYLAPDATAVGQIFWYTVEGDGRDLAELRSVQDWFVRYQLGSVPGVAEVASVGGAPKEYQIDLDPNKLRAYDVSLGEIYSAVARSNSSVGGRVIHQGNAEYLIRSVGWIEGVEDIRDTVVARRENGTPISVGQLGAVQVGPAFRRSALEKDGREVVGGVALMRYGENPLEVTRRIKDKISSIQAGLPAGVRIVPFYDRTPLIHRAIETVSGTVREELLVCSVAILVVMGHLGGAFVVSLTLPMAILFSFLLMRLAGVSSNIMSLAGIAISVGILIDQAVVMAENAAHHLTRRFGREKVRGDTTEIIVAACRTVGRPIFFSVLITILSFLPVFALSGREGKLFHPLAYTKTFALVGVAILSITLVPALIPIFLRGRIRSEDENPLVRTMIEIFKPMLSWLMDRPMLVCWSFAVIVGLGYVASTHLGNEFMPALDEGSILEMPTTVPRVSLTQAADDLRVRDALLRGFPEVWQVVGKAGRADTPTDPSGLDMIETVINLRDRPLWPRRMLRLEDAAAQAGVVLTALESGGLVPPAPADRRQGLIDEAVMGILTKLDGALRDLAALRLAEFRPELGRALVGDAIDELLRRVDPRAVRRTPDAPARAAIAEALAPSYADRLATEPLRDDVSGLIKEASGRLVELGLLEARPDLLSPAPGAWERARDAAWQLLGEPPASLDDRITDRVAEAHARRLRERVGRLNWELFDRGVDIINRAAVEELTRLAGDPKSDAGGRADRLRTLQDELRKPLSDRLILWPKTKNDLVSEMDSAVQMPGWGNIFTQPIMARIEMLSTGVRSQVAVKIFGDDLGKIQAVSQEVAAVLRTVPGAANVVPDQIVGKGYVEIRIDRKKAARYGVSVGDIQDVVEVAMGGKPLTMTVEKRERYPVRVRYARAFRDDVEALKRILVAGGSGMAAQAGGTGGGSGGMGMGGSGGSSSPAAAAPAVPMQVPLASVADVRVVEGPSMIKSENGRLRAYVQLAVRGRDETGFVEEARRVVERKVALPAGMYVEWSGQFEHQVRARQTLRIVFPAVIAVIVFILYLTYRSVVDTLLMMTSVLGALAGGAIFQWLFGFHFSVAVWVGYIACFGMAVETGVVMLVYLREAIDERGGLARIDSVAELKRAVLEGAVHRLRPKLLTEGAAIISIAPMLWATGVGAEVIRPMAAPVLGGLLIADEVIDVFLPVLYFAVQKRRWNRLNGISLFRPAVIHEAQDGSGVITSIPAGS